MKDIIGLTGGPVRPPLLDITDDEITELRAMLEGWQSIL